MRHLLLIFFALLLPLQVSWATVVAYGQEGAWKPALEKHLAHDVNAGSSVGSNVAMESHDAEGGHGLSPQHGDCSLCHLWHCGIVDGGGRPLALAAALPRPFAPPLRIPSPFADPPERPKWLPFA